jgi:hypothetical protein
MLSPQPRHALTTTFSTIAHTAPHHQSVNSEVQERASTLRYLLAEMEILPMSWENQAEEIKPGEKLAGAKGAKKGEIKAAIKEMNLLDEVDDLLDMPGVSVCVVVAYFYINSCNENMKCV